MSEFDKVFKDKLYDREVPFNQDAWQRAEAMIDANQSAVFWSFKRIAASLLALLTTAAIASYVVLGSLGEARYEKRAYTQPLSLNIYEGIIWPATPSSKNADNKTHKSALADTIASSEGGDSKVIISNQVKQEASSQVNDQVGSHHPVDLISSQEEQFKEHIAASENVTEAGLAQMDIKRNLLIKSKNKEGLKTDPVVSFEDKSSKEQKQRFRNHELSVVLNTGLANNFADPLVNSVGWGLSGALGFRYQYNLSENWSLATGLFYDLRNGSPLANTVEDVDYDYEAIRTISNYRTQSIHRLTVPLELGLNVKGKHNLRAGGRTSFIATTLTEVSSKSIIGDKTSESESQKEWGYLNGHEPLSFSGSLAYEYMLSPKWGLGCKAIFGLSDITDNGHFQNAVVDRDNQIQLTLRYRFIEF